ncbi:MAG: RNA-binding S4 domain-containing protein [Gammaproteobacteria bacterium]
MPDTQVLEIDTPVIELYKLLKLAGLASSGGEAKAFIDDGQVRLNGVLEKRKRKKIVAGDQVEFNARTLEVRASGADAN